MKVFKYQGLAELDETIVIKGMTGGKIVHAELAPLSATKCLSVLLWAEVYQTSTYTRKFGVYGTGHEVPPAAWHVLTVKDGPFVWHLYELHND